MGKNSKDKRGRGGGDRSKSFHQNSGAKPIQKFKAPSDSAATQNSRGLSALQAKFAKKLEGARFRMINEMLYTSRGDAALDAFQKDPKLFDIYHEGFREQASKWPENPLDQIIGWIKRKHQAAIIADLGAGDARLAQSIKNKVHSFDLVSKSPLVTAADIAHLPLADESVDIVVFCLSLMGTNIADFLKEAHRILKPRGIVKIAEVRSRFEGDAEGMKTFNEVLRSTGFDVTEKPSSNKMFFVMECVKSDRSPRAQTSADSSSSYSAKACVYKKR